MPMDVVHNCLVDSLTQFQVHGIARQEQSPSPTCYLDDPDIVKPSKTEQPIERNVTHYISTVGPLVHALPQRLSPECLMTAK